MKFTCKKIIEFEKKNWNILESQKFVIANSFDFIVETIGVFSNRDLIKTACEIMINKCEKFINLIQSESLIYEKSHTTLPNCFDQSALCKGSQPSMLISVLPASEPLEVPDNVTNDS